MVALKAITKASGEALEYAPYEVNLYHGCPHGCAYGSSGTCYVPGTKRVSGETFKANRDEIKKVTLGNLEQDLKNWQGERSIVHLCFLCDPYPIGWNTDKTRKCLELFRKYNHPFQVLTKGGFGACKDFDLYGPTDRFGTTLTCDNDADSLKWEPKAALPIERIESLKVAYEKGIKTWVSLEPVLDPKQTLHLIDLTHEFVDFYGVGKLNHNAELEKTIDWQLFRTDVETKLTGYGKDYKIKAALKVATPNFGKKRAELTETAGDASGSEHIEEAEARSLVAEEQFHEDAKASSPVSPESSFFKLMQKLLAELKADHEDKELDPLCKNRALSKDEYLDKLIQCRNENPADFKTTVNLLAEDSGLTATDIRKQINARVKESKSMCLRLRPQSLPKPFSIDMRIKCLT